MYKLTDIIATFQKASEAFSPISSNPNDGGLQRFNEVLVVYCLSVTLTGTANGITSDVVLPNSIYKANNGGAYFNFMRAARADCDPAIQNLTKDDRVSMMRGLEHSWAAGMVNQSRIRAIEVGARNLILANV